MHQFFPSCAFEKMPCFCFIKDFSVNSWLLFGGWTWLLWSKWYKGYCMLKTWNIAIRTIQYLTAKQFFFLDVHKFFLTTKKRKVGSFISVYLQLSVISFQAVILISWEKLYFPNFNDSYTMNVIQFLDLNLST